MPVPSSSLLLLFVVFVVVVAPAFVLVVVRIDLVDADSHMAALVVELVCCLTVSVGDCVEGVSDELLFYKCLSFSGHLHSGSHAHHRLRANYLARTTLICI
jgi:hypothetical protein